MASLSHPPPRIRRKRLQIAAASLRVQNAEGERRFPGTRNSCNRNFFSQRNLNVNILQVMHPRPMHGNCFYGITHRNSIADCGKCVRALSLDNFLHPYHVVPAVEFISAFVKFPHFGKAHVRVKIRAVVIQEFILFFCISDAGIKVFNAHFF